jgi:homoserine kinase
VDEAIEAGVREGAYAGWLSGSGSSVICATPVAAALDVRQAMEEVYRSNGISCRMANLSADNEGALVLDD